MAAVASADEQVRELHQKFADTLLSLVPSAMEHENLSPEELKRLNDEAVQKMLDTFPEGSEEREELERVLSAKVDADQRDLKPEEKRNWEMWGMVGCGALGVGAAWLSEWLHHCNLAEIKTAREVAHGLLQEAHNSTPPDMTKLQKAKDGLQKFGAMDCSNMNLDDPKWKKGLGNNFDSATTEKNFRAAGWADYVALVGSAVQLGLSCVALRTANGLKDDIMKQCSDASTSEEERANVVTWRSRLNKQNAILATLQAEYKAFLEGDVADLGKGGNMDADGMTPVYQRYNDFVMRTQAVVIAIMNLQMEIQKKDAELAAHLNTCTNLAVGTSIQTVVAFAQFIQRPNPITFINTCVLGTAAGVSTKAYFVTKEAKTALVAFGAEVEESLRQAQLFLAKMNLGRQLAQKSMDEYKELKSELKSKLQQDLEEEQRKSEAASKAASAAEAEIAELRRMLALAQKGG